MAARYLWLYLVVLGMSVGSLTNVAAGQVQPYGLVERVPNTSLLIDIENGLVPTTISASGMFSDVAAQTPAPGLIPGSRTGIGLTP